MNHNHHFIIKDQIIIENIELFDLLLKQGNKLLYGEFQQLSIKNRFPEVSHFHSLCNYFNYINHFNDFIKELKTLPVEKLKELSSCYKEGLSELNVSFNHIINRKKKSVPAYIQEIENETIRAILLNSWKFGNNRVRDKICDYLNGQSAIVFDLSADDADGKTTRKDNRIIYHLQSQWEKADKEMDLIKASLVFAHETHRDGYEQGNKQDTRFIVAEDILFIKRVVADTGEEFLDKNFFFKHLLYMNEQLSSEQFDSLVDSHFESAEDFLKINVNQSKQIQKLDNGWILIRLYDLTDEEFNALKSNGVATGTDTNEFGRYAVISAPQYLKVTHLTRDENSEGYTGTERDTFKIEEGPYKNKRGSMKFAADADKSYLSPYSVTAYKPPITLKFNNFSIVRDGNWAWKGDLTCGSIKAKAITSLTETHFIGGRILTWSPVPNGTHKLRLPDYPPPG